MPPRKGVARFLARLVLTYALLVVAPPLLQPACVPLYRFGGELLFGAFGSDGVVQFRPHPIDGDYNNTAVIVSNRLIPGATAAMQSSSRYIWYLPATTLGALIVATPLPWRRRCTALLWRIPLLGVFAAFRLGTGLLNAFSDDTPFRTVVLSRWLKQTLLFLVKAFWASRFTCTLVVPAVIWFIVTHRKGVWADQSPQRNTRRADTRH